MTEKDLVGGSPDILTDYSYSTAGSSTAVLWGHDDGAARWSTPLARRSWGDWRGYPTVTVTVGPSGGTQTQTKHLYFRGLHGDYLAQGKPTRVATITNSAGDVWQDHFALAGMLHETIQLDGPGGSQLTRAITDPVRHQTGQRIISDAWAIPVTQTSTITRVGRERDYTWIAATSSWRLAETANTWHPAYGVLTQVNDLGDTGTSADDMLHPDQLRTQHHRQVSGRLPQSRRDRRGAVRNHTHLSGRRARRRPILLRPGHACTARHR